MIRTTFDFIGKRLPNTGSYLMILGLALGIKRYYSHAGSDELRWILAPVAYIVDLCSDLAFTYEPASGFIDRVQGIIIAPGCSGINFLIITLCMTAYLTLARFPPKSGRLAWLGFSMATAYIFTIVANTTRIAIAIGLYQLDIYGGWLTPARVHRLAGILVYLFLLYGLFRWLTRRGRPSGRQPVILKTSHTACALIPLMCYMAVTIGIPLLNGAYQKGAHRFLEHCAMIVAGGAIVLFTIYLLNLVFQRMYNKFITRAALCKNEPAARDVNDR